jgi:hypothetical protein
VARVDELMPAAWTIWLDLLERRGAAVSEAEFVRFAAQRLEAELGERLAPRDSRPAPQVVERDAASAAGRPSRLDAFVPEQSGTFSADEVELARALGERYLTAERDATTLYDAWGRPEVELAQRELTQRAARASR